MSGQVVAPKGEATEAIRIVLRLEGFKVTELNEFSNLVLNT